MPGSALRELQTDSATRMLLHNLVYGRSLRVALHSFVYTVCRNYIPIEYVTTR